MLRLTFSCSSRKLTTFSAHSKQGLQDMYQVTW